MKKQILIILFFSSSILSLNAQNWSGTTPGKIYYNSGNVGIGETNPNHKLSINQIEDISTADQYRFPLKLVLSDAAGGLWQGTGVGMKFNVNASDANFDSAEIISIAKTAGVTNGDLVFRTAKAGVLSTQLTINPDGKVGIGIENPAFKLDVCGTIRAREVKVDLQGTCVPDFVFKKDYKLMSLNELEKFVTTKQHLPEIAPEKEMIENGLDVKDFQMKLLQKMEEMTLYIIDQNKKNKKQEQELKILKAKIKKLESNKR